MHVPARACLLDSPQTRFDSLHQEWISQTTALTSANEDIYRLYRQSVKDMCALRLYDHDMVDDVWVPAAGVPWFVTLFGRDSLIVSLQNMMVNPEFAGGALKKLVELQAAESDDYRDADPGKIMHEIRFGEPAHFHHIPHIPYYGTADAAPLYLIVLHDAWKWTGDDALIRKYRDVALRCLEWIDRYGDLDNDGFQKYQTPSTQGCENMSWKDSGDAIGRRPPPPLRGALLVRGHRLLCLHSGPRKTPGPYHCLQSGAFAFGAGWSRLSAPAESSSG